jgi:hypothetical protein
MRKSHKFLFAMTMFAPSICHGQGKCPWIDEATARSILGKDDVRPMTATVTIGPSRGTCDFSWQDQGDGDVRRQLWIDVLAMTDIPKQFPSVLYVCTSNLLGPKPLPTIGEETVLCNTRTHTKLFVGTVVGRVRNQAFNVRVASSLRDDPSLNEETRREKAQLVAAQVVERLQKQDK